MAENESGSEKTEQPTAKRRSDAKEKGQVAKSVDLNAAFILLSGLILLYFYGSGIQTALVQFTRECFGTMSHVDFTLDWFLAENPNWIKLIMELVTPFMAFLAMLTLFIAILQTGFMWTVKPFTEPDFSKFINPFSGIAKIFKRDNWIRLVMSLGKLAIIMTVAYLVIKANISSFITMSLLEMDSVFEIAVGVTFRLGVYMALAMLILGIIDFQYQKFTTTDGLKMTKDEVKEETKSMDGDPKMRNRRRSVQMRLARERMMKEVAEADVVITNPVELAVAIKYDADFSDAPVVVAKGARLMAQRIKELAYSNQIAVVENKAMARALYEAVEVGEHIPERLFRGVAEILAYVMQTNNSKQAS